jgi:tetratricopeptide (TPR) repeat protein
LDVTPPESTGRARRAASIRRRIAPCLLPAAAALGLLLAARPAAAQQAPAAAQQVPAAAQQVSDADSLGQAVYANPADLALGYTYARALLSVGRFQDAAMELERMLVIEPAQPQLQLELGVIHFRLGNFVLARSYLTRAQASPDLEPELRARADDLLREAERRSSRSQFAGSVSFGMRFQTNANGGILPSTLGTVDGPRPLPGSLKQRSDVNAFFGAEVTHFYDLDLQREAAIVSSLGFYTTRQTSADFYNFAGLTLRSGLRFAPAPETLPSLRLYPYVRGDTALLNDNFYNAAAGPGLELSINPTTRLLASLTLEQRFASYDAVPRVPNAKVLSGDESVALLRIGYALRPTVTLFATGGLRDVTTRQQQFDFDEYQLGGGVAAFYPAPIGSEMAQHWNLAATVGHFWRRYAGPDPQVDPSRTRSEREWRFRIANEIPIFRGWLAVQQAEYWRNNANISNYDRDNFTLLAGLTYRF